MELTCYVDGDGGGFELRPAPSRRDWMDEARNRAPYRCLPMVVANGFGWEILTPVGFTAVWHGGNEKEGVVVVGDGGLRSAAHSHFGDGIITFSIPMIFRTDVGTDLVVQGPINRPKDAIAPLTGIVESDWGPFNFTMNWKFTRTGTEVRFEKGEPFCHIFPVRRGDLESIHPRILPLSANSELQESHAQWHRARMQFNEDLKVEGSAARAAKWQKHYQQGKDPKGQTATPSHRSKTILRPFT
jgi:hypothetical protein